MTKPISIQMEELAVAHGMPCGKRKMLEPRNVQEFAGDSLFYHFARTVCKANAIPRKELFETWTMAIHVYDKFPETRRVADLACSHGLLSWALLLLYNDVHNESKTAPRKIATSAVCVDVRMPLSAEKLAGAMLEEWPDLKDHWDYVEGSVDGIIPCSSTLLVAVHACAQLSDKIIANAIHGNTPVALVPCCHSKKSLLPQQRSQLLCLDKVKSTINLADLIDNYRIQRLEEAGMKVQEAYIPDMITPKNRILLATPYTEGAFTLSTCNRLDPSLKLSKISIPLGNTCEAKAVIKSLAGRRAANQRKEKPPPTLGLCLFLPVGKDISEEQVLQAVQMTTEQQGNVTVKTINQEPHFDKSSGRFTRTFRLTYNDVSTKQQAKQLFVSLCYKIPEVFPGASPRQIPR